MNAYDIDGPIVYLPSIPYKQKRDYEKINLNKLDKVIDEFPSDKIGLFYIYFTYFQLLDYESIRGIHYWTRCHWWKDGEICRFIRKDKGIDKTFQTKGDLLEWIQTELIKIEGIE